MSAREEPLQSESPSRSEDSEVFQSSAPPTPPMPPPAQSSSAQSSSAQSSSAARPPAPSSSVRPTLGGWRSAFLAALGNLDGTRTSGFFARSTSSGLVALQKASLEQDLNPGVLVARYRIAGPPGPGTLVAALASDILSVQNRSAQLLGDLQTKRPDGWQSYVSALAPNGDLTWLQSIARGSALSADEIRSAFERLAAPLDRADRLVILGRVESRNIIDDLAWINFSNMPLPVQVAVVCAFSGPQLGMPITQDPLLFQIPLTFDGVPLDEEAAETAYRQDRVANLTEDRPARKDELGRATLAGTLANLLMHPETKPLCIGIEAPWGKGKSTFLNLVEDVLYALAAPDTDTGADLSTRTRTARSRVVVTRFEAWQYDNAQEAWAGLARQVIGGIEASFNPWQRLRLRWAYAWRYRRRSLLGGAGAGLAALALAAVLVSSGGSAVLSAADVKSPVAKAVAVVLSPTLLSFVALLAGLFKLTKPVSARVTDYLARPDYGERLGFQHQVIRDLKFCKRWFDAHRPTARIVVMVDDLDRCSDDKIVEILQAINVVLADSGLYVLLGLDGDVVRRAIYRHYVGEEEKLPTAHRLPADFAADYLRKIVQFSVHLPDSSNEERARYLDALLQQPVDAAEAAAPATSGGDRPFAVNLAQLMPPQIVREIRVRDTLDDITAMKSYQQVLEDNPRELKRLVNMHRFIKIALLSADPHSTTTPRTQRLLVQWLMFCTAWPYLVEHALDIADDRPTEPDVLAAAVNDAQWLSELRALLPEDIITAEDLAYGSPLRRAAGLAVNLP